MSLHQNNKTSPRTSQTPLCFTLATWPLQSEIGMLLINFLELDVVAARVTSWQVANMPSTCHHPAMALRGRLQKGTLVARQGNGMACVNQTRPHYVNQMGKTQSNDLAERHGRGTAGEQHGNGMVCVNPPLAIPLVNSMPLLRI
jgi:hypothetical protein